MYILSLHFQIEFSILWISRNRLITLDSSHNGILDEREECYKVFVGYIVLTMVLLNFDLLVLCTKVMRVESNTFGDPVIQKVFQNQPSSLIIGVL